MIDTKNKVVENLEALLFTDSQIGEISATSCKDSAELLAAILEDAGDIEAFKIADEINKCLYVAEMAYKRGFCAATYLYRETIKDAADGIKNGTREI